MSDSGNSDQLAHNWHTMRRVAEIKALVQMMEDLAVRWEEKRAVLGNPPEHQPWNEQDGKMLLLDMDKVPPCLKPDSAEDATRQAAAQDAYFAVASPLSTVWRPLSNEKASETQLAMLAWRRDFDSAVGRLGDYCARYRRESVLNRSLSSPADLRRSVELLLQELENVDPGVSLVLRLERDPAIVLREAREIPPKQSRTEAAKAMNVKPETVRSWEKSRRRPAGENWLDVQAYVLARNGIAATPPRSLTA